MTVLLMDKLTGHLDLAIQISWGWFFTERGCESNTLTHFKKTHIILDKWRTQ